MDTRTRDSGAEAPDLTTRIGQRIREARKQRGWSLSHLEAKTGGALSKTRISVERDHEALDDCAGIAATLGHDQRIDAHVLARGIESDLVSGTQSLLMPNMIDLGQRARTRLILWSITLALLSGGCAWRASPPASGLRVSVSAPILIPPGRAHAVFHDGRLVGAGSQLDPYCELEVRQVSGEAPQRITHGDFQVSRISRRLLLDPTTRMPPLSIVSSCSDPLYQESLWTLSSPEPSEVLFLRCLAPYFNCAFGPPLSPEQVQRQVGRYLTVETLEPMGPH